MLGAKVRCTVGLWPNPIRSEQNFSIFFNPNRNQVEFESDVIKSEF